MLSRLLASNVDFLLVGAYAMAAHGFPRATADIDILVRPDADNAKRLYRALVEFGAPLHNVTEQDFAAPGAILQIGVQPRRIDIITEIDGLTFSQAAEGKKMVNLEGLAVPVIAKNKLIANKQATGREKDRLDVETLKRAE
jgi:hypothetical protein